MEIKNASDDATTDGLLFVGDRSKFFPADGSKALMRGISQTKLDEHLEQYDVVTGNRRKRPLSEDTEEY